MVKRMYEVPTMEVISLASIQETMQSASANSSGSDVVFQDPSSFDDFFGIL